MDQQLLIRAYEASKKRQSYAFATVIETTLKGTPRKSGAKMIVYENGSSFGTIGGGRNEKNAQKECLKALKTGKPSLVTYDYFGGVGQSVCGGQLKVYIEPFCKQPELIICGAGHIALPLSIIGKMLNFRVTIIDDRKAFANFKRFSHVDAIVVGPHAKKLAQLKLDKNCYIMIVTQGNEYDYACLREVIKSQAAYIGVISSKAKKIKFSNRLKKEGVSEKFLKRVNIPAGINIGSQTPEEIAISIVSEIVNLKNKDFLKTAKFKDKFQFS